MKKKNSQMSRIACFGIIIMGLIACATKPALNIQYQLPEPSRALDGRRIDIQFEDNRTDPWLLDAAAKKQLSDFSGKFTFQTDPNQKPRTSDLYDVSTLFRETLRKRLSQMGVAVVSSAEEKDATLKVILTAFKLKFVDGSWKANIAYEGQLLQDGNVRARQNISGNAERVKIIGTDGADKVVGDVYTDVLNQLNIVELFRLAGLME